MNSKKERKKKTTAKVITRIICGILAFLMISVAFVELVQILINM